MEREIHVGGDAPVRRARLELAPVDGGPVPLDSCRDIAQRSEAAGQVVLTGMQAQIQEQVLGREHPRFHAGNTCGEGARPHASDVNREWPAGAVEVPMDFEGDIVGRRLGLYKNYVVMMGFEPVCSCWMRLLGVAYSPESLLHPRQLLGTHQKVDVTHRS